MYACFSCTRIQQYLSYTNYLCSSWTNKKIVKQNKIIEVICIFPPLTAWNANVRFALPFEIKDARLNNVSPLENLKAFKKRSNKQQKKKQTNKWTVAWAKQNASVFYHSQLFSSSSQCRRKKKRIYVSTTFFRWYDTAIFSFATLWNARTCAKPMHFVILTFCANGIIAAWY